VFGENKQRWWFWLISCEDAAVYLLDPSRSNKVPNEFFAGSTGILMSDRFSSYKGMQASIRKAWCWAHMRRDILNIYNGIPKLKTWAKAWLLEITRLYVLHHGHFSLWKQGTTEGENWDAEKMVQRSIQNRSPQGTEQNSKEHGKALERTDNILGRSPNTFGQQSRRAFTSQSSNPAQE
jgi:hypothetical protein